jgi:hypothetical protein
VRTSLIILALFFCASAQAAERVIHDGDAAAARALVAERAGLDAGGLVATSLDELLANTSRPALGPSGTVQRCQGAPLSLDVFEETLSEAEGDVLYMDYPKAIDRLGRVTTALPCIDAVPTAGDLARTWFLLGFARGMAGQEDSARLAFGNALAVQPELAWDPNFPTGPRALLEEQRAVVGARARLTIVPPAADKVFVDGLERPELDQALLLAPGAHLVQLVGSSVRSYGVELETERRHQLLLPGPVDGSTLAWALDPERRPELEALLSASVGQQDQLFVVRGDQAVAGQLGGEWTFLQPAWIDPEQRNAELREAMRAVRVATAVDFYSTELALWLTSPGQPRAVVTPGQVSRLPLGDSLLEARWGGQERSFPLVVAETPAVIEALQRHQRGELGIDELTVDGPRLPLPWALAVKVGEETVVQELHPGTKQEAFVSLDLSLPVEGAPKVHVTGSVLGVQGTVRTLQLDPGQHPAIPLHDALRSARSIKRKDSWVAPLGIALGTGLGVWAGMSWSQATTLAAEAKAMDADPELVDAYNSKVAEATAAQRRSWLSGGGAALSLGLGVGYELTLGAKKRRKVAAARAAWRATLEEPVELDALTVDWQ